MVFEISSSMISPPAEDKKGKIAYTRILQPRVNLRNLFLGKNKDISAQIHQGWIKVLYIKKFHDVFSVSSLSMNWRNL